MRTLLLSFVVGLGMMSLAANEVFFRAPTVNGTSVEAKLGRWQGQTEFYNPYTVSRAFDGLESARSVSLASGKSAAPTRAIQESDVFKVGNPGSQLLFLLNRYRGLQVVSFADGVEKPQVVGRVAPTGNNPDDMYFDAKNNRLIVLERNWYDQSGNYNSWSETQSRLVVYDVSNPEQPAIASMTDVKGEISEHRLVGDVLYLVTKIRPNRNSRDRTGKGYVFSYNISDSKSIQAVDEMQLAFPSAYEGTMGIVRDGEKYFLVATLNSSNWWWSSDNATYVEVVDISDAQGKIKPVMVVATKGRIRERSQSIIKDNTLIVVSNYNTHWRARRSNLLARIAVETFKFPGESTKALSQAEATYRKAWLAKELDGVANNTEEYIKRYNELVANSEKGMRGQFEMDQQVPGRMLKGYADTLVTTGSTDGQNASLQDVRVEGDYLYAFWVPSNLIDPLDVFDISQPSEGVEYLYRVEYDGWVERAFPITHEGRRFIVGLGWVEPAENNETRRRYPQAILIELEKKGQKTIGYTLANKTFNEQSAWGNLNIEEKYFDVKFNDGKGEILFPYYATVDGAYKQGGKLLYFDMNAANEHDYDNFFKEGGFLVGESSYIKRIFNNSEINRINSFSNERLSIYADGSALERNAKSTVQAAATLELARNIRDYAHVDGMSVQVISKDQRCGFRGCDQGSVAGTELRLVDFTTPDAEQKDIADSKWLSGYYEASYVDPKTKQSYILTRTPIFPKAELHAAEGDFVPSTHNNYKVYALSAAGRSISSNVVTSWEEEVVVPDFGGGIGFPRSRRGLIAPWGRHSAPTKTFTALEGQKVVIASNSGLKVLDTQSNQVTDYEFNNCGVEAGTKFISDLALPMGEESVDFPENLYTDLEVKFVGGKPYLFYKEIFRLQLPDQAPNKLYYSKNFIQPMTITGDAIQCGEAVNIPGEPMEMLNGYLVTKDDWVTNISTQQVREWRPTRAQSEGNRGDYVWVTNYKYNVATSLASLDYKAVATMTDIANYAAQYQQELTMVDGEILFTDSGQFNNPRIGFGRPINRNYASDHHFNFVTVKNGQFVASTSTISMTAGAINVAAIFTNADGSNVALIQDGRNYSVATWTKADKKVSMVPVYEVDANNQKGEASETFLLYQYYYGPNNMKVSYDEESGAFDFAMGNYGVKRVYTK